MPPVKIEDNFPHFQLVWLSNNYNEGTFEKYTHANFWHFNLDEKLQGDALDELECKEYFTENISYQNQTQKPTRTFCPDMKGYELAGSTIESFKNKQHLKFDFIPCSGTSPCNTQEAAQALQKSNMRLMVKNFYVDLEDIDTPIKNFTDSVYHTLYTYDTNIFVDIEVIQNEVYLDDALFPIFGGQDPIIFYSFNLKQVEKLTLETNPNVSITGNMQVRVDLSPQVKQYRRKVLTFLEVIGIVGGILEFLELTTGVLVSACNYYTFKKAIVKMARKKDSEFEQLRHHLKLFRDQNKISQLQKHIEQQELPPREQIEEFKNLANPQTTKTVPPYFSSKYVPVRMNESVHQNERDPEMEPPDAELNQPPNLSTGKAFQKLKQDLDCLSMVYSIKELEVKVEYLLERDLAYAQFQPPKQPRQKVTQSQVLPMHGRRSNFASVSRRRNLRVYSMVN